MTSKTMKRLCAICWVALLVPALSAADSGVGVDTWRANKLDPSGGMAVQGCDPVGTSWLAPLQRRSPTGNLYNCPAEAPLLENLGDQWVAYGDVQLGYVATGDDRYALWNRYTDWQRNNAVLGLLDLHFENPRTGEYAEVRGSRISDDDQYYQAVFGQAGAFKVQAFLRDMPNILSTDARPIWNGVGTNQLTLPASLPPGVNSAGQVAAVSAATPVSSLAVTRRKEGLDVSGWLTPELTGYLSVSHEGRKGERPYGGPFGEDWPPNLGAILETVKPIDDYTINLNAGLRYAGEVWRGEIGYSGSYYRDRWLSYSFQQPFNIPSTAPVATTPGLIVPPVTQGQMSMEPDNDYHNLHGSLTRVVPLNGELSISFSEVLMEQHDNLIAPTNCQGFLGWGVPASGTTLTTADVGPQNPALFNCSQWNTTAALSQQNANVNMRNTLAQIGLTLRPVPQLSVDTGFKFYRQAYYNNYLAYNPENGYYGYVAENGAFLHTYNAQLSFANGAFPAGVGVINGRVLPFLLSMDDINFHGGVTWRPSGTDTFGVLYTFDEYRPTSRERDYVDDNSIKLTWVDKSLDHLTLRANYTFLRQTGSVYDTDVYGYSFLQGQPAYQAAFPGAVPAPETVAQLRKYDIDNRTENKIDLMATLAVTDDFNLSASFRGDWNRYPVLVGRQDYDTLAAQLSAEWTPTTTTNVSAYVGYDRSRLTMASVAGQPGNGPTCPDLGCPFYADAYRWSETDHERNYSAGLTLAHRLDFVTLDLSYLYIYSRGVLEYAAASTAALVYPTEPMGSSFPAMTYRVSSVTLGATFRVTDRVSLRVFDNYEAGRIADWHYAGFNQGLVVDNTVYTDAGPQSYSENLIGLLVNIKL